MWAMKVVSLQTSWRTERVIIKVYFCQCSETVSIMVRNDAVIGHSAPVTGSLVNILYPKLKRM